MGIISRLYVIVGGREGRGVEGRLKGEKVKGRSWKREGLKELK